MLRGTQIAGNEGSETSGAAAAHDRTCGVGGQVTAGPGLRTRRHGARDAKTAGLTRAGGDPVAAPTIGSQMGPYRRRAAESRRRAMAAHPAGSGGVDDGGGIFDSNTARR